MSTAKVISLTNLVCLKYGSVDIPTRVDDGYGDIVAFLGAGGTCYPDLIKELHNGSKLGKKLKLLATFVGLPVRAQSPGTTERGLIETNGRTENHFRGWLHPEAILPIATNLFGPGLAFSAVRYFTHIIRTLPGVVSASRRSIIDVAAPEVKRSNLQMKRHLHELRKQRDVTLKKLRYEQETLAQEARKHAKIRLEVAKKLRAQVRTTVLLQLVSTPLICDVFH